MHIGTTGRDDALEGRAHKLLPLAARFQKCETIGDGRAAQGDATRSLHVLEAIIRQLGERLQEASVPKRRRIDPPPALAVPSASAYASAAYTGASTGYSAYPAGYEQSAVSPHTESNGMARHAPFR